jgi:putative transposase
MQVTMRVEPFGIGSVLHITNRGVRGADIVRDGDDRARFRRSLYYLNDTHTDPYWHRSVADLPVFSRPKDWPEREPIVRILAWTLLSNHFHLLLQETTEGGIAKFMQRLGGSLSTCFNAKYQERGSLFQGSYRARLVSQDEHRQYLIFYVLIKNVLEMYPGGLSAARTDFDQAWEWAVQYPHSSLHGSIFGSPSPIIDDPEDLINSIINAKEDYKNEARELLDFYLQSKGEEFNNLMLESW